MSSFARSTSPAGGLSLSKAEPGDFFALLKPRVMSLVVFTALTGMALAPPMNPVLGFTALLAIAVGAGASGCLNMWYDADIDAVMGRTATRPIPSGRVSPDEALAFGLVLSVGSVALLGLVTNWLAAGLLAFTIVFYAVIYSAWLKRWTPQNIVIGGAAGAMPPMIGYAAATGHVNLESAILFGIIFLWTPPHFWALALLKVADYRRANVPMLPVVAGDLATRRQILLYTLVLVPFALLPYLMDFAGLAYAATAVVTGAMMIRLAWHVLTRTDEAEAKRANGKLFGFSILYLFALFAVILAERALGLSHLGSLKMLAGILTGHPGA